MYGFEAIQQANGWAMAGAGALIVLIGLTVLSFLLSMLPRITPYFEKQTPAQKKTTVEPEPVLTAVPTDLPFDIGEASKQLIDRTQDLGEAFTLVALHQKIRALGVVDPHLTIRRFREAGLLVAKGEERFAWQPLAD